MRPTPLPHPPLIVGDMIREVYESLKNLNEVIGTQYGDRVLFELVQNGHDAHPTSAAEAPGEIAVRLLVTADDCGELLVANRGRAFTRSNLDAVINIGTSDKRIGAPSGRFDGYCFRFASRGEIENDLLMLGATSDEARHVAGRLFNFLPMIENAIAPIGGHIDAPFFADIDRRSMKPDLPLNRFLLEAAARTCALAATTIVDCGIDLPSSVVVDLAA